MGSGIGKLHCQEPFGVEKGKYLNSCILCVLHHVPVCTCVFHVCAWCPCKLWIPGTGVTTVVNQHWEPNLGTLEEQQVLLAISPAPKEYAWFLVYWGFLLLLF